MKISKKSVNSKKNLQDYKPEKKNWIWEKEVLELVKTFIDNAEGKEKLNQAVLTLGKKIEKRLLTVLKKNYGLSSRQ